MRIVRSGSLRFPCSAALPTASRIEVVNLTALSSGKPVSEEEGARDWRRVVFEPAIKRLKPAIGQRDPLQAYCDVLEHKWLLSELAGRDVGLESAIAAYLEVGAPAPEPPSLLA